MDVLHEVIQMAILRIGVQKSTVNDVYQKIVPDGRVIEVIARNHAPA